MGSNSFWGTPQPKNVGYLGGGCFHPSVRTVQTRTPWDGGAGQRKLGTGHLTSVAGQSTVANPRGLAQNCPGRNVDRRSACLPVHPTCGSHGFEGYHPATIATPARRA